MSAGQYLMFGSRSKFGGCTNYCFSGLVPYGFWWVYYRFSIVKTISESYDPPNSTHDEDNLAVAHMRMCTHSQCSPNNEYVKRLMLQKMQQKKDNSVVRLLSRSCIKGILRGSPMCNTMGPPPNTKVPSPVGCSHVNNPSLPPSSQCLHCGLLWGHAPPVECGVHNHERKVTRDITVTSISTWIVWVPNMDEGFCIFTTSTLLVSFRIWGSSVVVVTKRRIEALTSMLCVHDAPEHAKNQQNSRAYPFGGVTAPDIGVLSLL